ncbi:MAG TPA: cell wall hydrolase [Burkholderiales bacterium]|nr:cell wall hydrolase [Burkholderiales bacterium]
MRGRLFNAGFVSDAAWAVSRRWQAMRLYWYFADKEPWIFVLVLVLIVAAFAFALRATYARQDERRSLACLARNVYFEARGEPAEGQYAVAEVTMNRLASGRYPGTVCGVVYQKNWDPLRKRYVGAFSWTEFDVLPPPSGEQWLQAWQVAEAVYYGREAPVLDGAMFFHATYIKPDWAKTKKPLARIGGHVFYR